jgi:hypothetical protein
MSYPVRIVKLALQRGSAYYARGEGNGLGLSLAADILTRPDVILRTTEA